VLNGDENAHIKTNHDIIVIIVELDVPAIYFSMTLLKVSFTGSKGLTPQAKKYVNEY